MTVLLGTAAWDAGALKSSLPVLTSPVSAITPLTPIYRLGGAASFTRPQRPRWGLFAIVGVALLFVAAGGYELLRDDPSDQARSALAAVPLRSDAVQSAPGENLSATRGATVRVPGDMSHVDEALRTAELVGRASPMEDVAEPAVAPAAGLGAGPVAGLAAGPAAGPGFVPARPLASSALAHRADSAVALAPVTSRRGKTATHGSSRFTSSRAAAEPVAAAPQRQYDSRGTRPAPVGSFGPCTSTVAALGLCTPASPSQPKE